MCQFTRNDTKPWDMNGDCCFWDGITCDDKSGHVIELDLRCNCLYGQINSSSSLFRLQNLASLDLAYNNFNYSLIPTEFNKLMGLTRLDLSMSSFSGQIPMELFHLTKLESLHLSSSLLSVEKSFLDTLVWNLTNLKELYLTSIDISSEIPQSISNLSSLRSLDLDKCNLIGEIPRKLLLMPTLQNIYFRANYNLKGSLPEFNGNNSLVSLALSGTSLLGNIPNSISNLKHLTTLMLGGCNLGGKISSSLGNLSHLKVLDLAYNNFIGPFPTSISKLVKLQFLDLSDFNTQLRSIDFGIFSHFTSLVYLYLSNLNTTTIDLNAILSPLMSLKILDLSSNHVSTANMSSTSNLPFQLHYLQLSSCGITEFPKFIKTQQQLIQLQLSNNKIKDRVPGWLWDISSLLYVDLSNNKFNGFDNFAIDSSRPPIDTLDTLYLSSNNFQGPVFVPPRPITYLDASKNNFSGEIPKSICDMIFLEALELSDNNFNGSIPQCFSNLINRNLSVLKLDKNHLSGRLPEIFINCINLKSLSFGHNQLAGKLPRSLIGCSSLEVLNIEHNRFNDVFPIWLTSLQKLQVLVLRFNQFYGSLQYHPPVASWFPQLRIIDISRNAFTGILPSDYFMYWSAMFSEGDLLKRTYIGDNYSYHNPSMVLMNKGIELKLERILTIYTSLDFSGNKFKGKIPRSICLLKGLRVLNLSNNAFTGHIPSSMANLTTLESLDVSRNQLSGKIPQELGILSNLEWMNFSHNQLMGVVPAGQQFRTQHCSSFQDNLGLYGPTLDEVCKDIHAKAAQQPETSEAEENEEEMLSWKAAAIGVGPGVVFGATIGCIVFSDLIRKSVESFCPLAMECSCSTRFPLNQSFFCQIKIQHISRFHGKRNENCDSSPVP